MSAITFNRDELRDKIYGCWIGKNIGGTLGGPYEGLRDILDVKGYTTKPGQVLPNDDLDLQMVWLRAIEDRGPRAITAALLGEYWINFISPHWNEYGINKANQRAGLVPPLCGMYNNIWKDSNGAWIRSEIWACMAPGCPDVAIKYAYEDACVDHGNGEGMYAALFTTALQSAAFVVSDREELIKIGMSKIPEDCRVARSINVAIKAHADGKTWKEARELVMEDSADLGWFQAPGNIAFMVIGWLYGEGDLGKSLLIAVNCGDDTDCTAATLGAIFGIIQGKSGLPAEWVEPIGDNIVTVALDRGSIAPPTTCSDLTDHVLNMAPKVLDVHNCPVQINDNPTDISAAKVSDMMDTKVAKELWDRSPYSVIHDLVHTKVMLDYGADPEITAGEPFPMKLTFWNLLNDPRHIDIKWHLPAGWRVLPSDKNHIFMQQVDITGQTKHELTVDIVADEVTEIINRGIVEIIAHGRPTVGLIPLVFFNKGV